MKKIYVKPECDIIKQERAEIIAASGVVPGFYPNPFDYDDVQ